jgi:hypothetical protein
MATFGRSKEGLDGSTERVDIGSSCDWGTTAERKGVRCRARSGERMAVDYNEGSAVEALRATPNCFRWTRVISRRPLAAFISTSTISTTRRHELLHPRQPPPSHGPRKQHRQPIWLSPQLALLSLLLGFLSNLLPYSHPTSTRQLRRSLFSFERELDRSLRCGREQTSCKASDGDASKAEDGCCRRVEREAFHQEEASHG